MPFRQYIRKRDQQGEYWGGQSFDEHLSLCELQLTTDLLLEHLPEEIAGRMKAAGIKGKALGDPLRESEAKVIRETLIQYAGHRGKTARALGMHPSTLWRKMKRLGIKVN